MSSLGLINILPLKKSFYGFFRVCSFKNYVMWANIQKKDSKQKAFSDDLLISTKKPRQQNGRG